MSETTESIMPARHSDYSKQWSEVNYVACEGGCALFARCLSVGFPLVYITPFLGMFFLMRLNSSKFKLKCTD